MAESSVASSSRLGLFGSGGSRQWKRRSRSNPSWGHSASSGSLLTSSSKADLHPRVQVGDDMQLQGAVAVVVRVQLDLPPLPSGRDVDAVVILVIVEPAFCGVVLEIRDEPGKVDDGQGTTPRRWRPPALGQEQP